MSFTLSLYLLLTFIQPAASQEELPQVQISTSLGNIIIELYPEKAPISSENFLKYIGLKLSSAASFYRVVDNSNQPNNDVKIEVIQGGLRPADSTVVFGPIAHETTQKTGVKHKNGTLSMARNEPGSATSEFFICINDQPELDFGGRRNPDGQGFSAFGQVIEGMDIVKAIQQQPSSNQYLVKPVQILSTKKIK